jgi:ABC-type branched-subunit amino acid transport system ATPase component
MADLTVEDETRKSVLVVENLTVRYSNGAAAVQGVNLELKAKTIVAVLGRNGAGKTSLLRGVGGFLRSEHVSVEGRVRIGNSDICGRTPMKAHRHGVVSVPERDKVFPSLTVGEHFKLIAPNVERSEVTAGFTQLEKRWHSRAGLLSGGERQMLALAVAWLQRPRVLLIDEMSLGLAPVIVRELMRRLAEVTAALGTATMVVEQDASAALSVAEYVYLLDRGTIVWEGPSDSITADEMGRNYLGTRV